MGAVMLALALLVGGGVAVARGKKKSSGAAAIDPAAPSIAVTPKNVPPDLLALYEQAEQLLAWPGLAAYLAAVSWTESRWNPKAYNPSGASGLFQLKPTSAKIDEFGLPKSALFDPRWSVVLYVWYLTRLRNYAGSGQTIDWLALRRGGAFPSLVSDTDESEKRSRDVRSRFESALGAIDVPKSFAARRAFPKGWTWSGPQALAAALGAGGSVS